MQSLWMLLAGLAFAGMGVCVKLASPQFSIAELVLYRALAQMGGAWIVLWRAHLPVRTARLGLHANRGLSGFASLFMFFYSLRELPVATAMTLNYASPLWLALLIVFLARERPGAGLLVCVVLGFAGVLLLLQPTLTANMAWPFAIGLVSGILAAIAYLNVRDLVQANEPEARVVFYFALFSAIGALVWMIPQAWTDVSLANAWPLVGIGVCGTVGQLAMTRAYGKGSTLVAAALSYSGIVFSSILGALLLDERLPWIAWLAMVLIVAAGIMSIRMLPRTAHAEPAAVTSD
ncbi:MAG TPA: DMT family transporter [Casimicrobiaceae bacterium]|nr:DMT family transporter [Casimicrobiaceae bacterium]